MGNFHTNVTLSDTGILAALADDLSSSLDTRAFAVLNHDDDVLWFQLYDRGTLVAEYANRGGGYQDIQGDERPPGLTLEQIRRV